MRYEPCLDGLFTYCLSVLCDHDAAVAALGDALVLAERRGWQGPDAEGERRAWLYALARWACLRRLAEPAASGSAPGEPAAESDESERRQGELALLAWPEAAGTSPEQREALELAVRHQLAAPEIADVLGMDRTVARDLLSSAACEVERTRAAVAVVEEGGCAGVARFTGDGRLVLSAALRLELVRHVDDCPRCRRTAERAAPGVWPGAGVTPSALPVLRAPRAALCTAMAHAPRARGGPRFDRRGFPVDPRDHAARRHRLRARAVTTLIVATVAAAPVFALWAAYRGAPLIGEGREGHRPVMTSEAQGPAGFRGGAGSGYENAGNARTKPDVRFSQGREDVSVEVTGDTGEGREGRLSVAARTSGDTTLITLEAFGGSPARWSARAGAAWLRLDRASGTVAPGRSSTIRVYVDHVREPRGRWGARVSISPSAAAVLIEGYGAWPSRPESGPGAGVAAVPSASR